MAAERSFSGGVTGVVLCGGRSARMGFDKAAARVAGASLLEAALAALEPVCGEILLACGPAERYREVGRRLVLDRLEGGGPLAGLEAGLAGSRTDWIAALACDMPRAEPRVFEALLERALEEGLDACLLGSADGVEPLCAVYRRTCLPAVRAALEAGERKVTSFERFASSSGRPPRVGILPEAELPGGLAGRGVARNLNTPEELAREAALAGTAGRSP